MYFHIDGFIRRTVKRRNPAPVLYEELYEEL